MENIYKMPNGGNITDTKSLNHKNEHIVREFIRLIDQIKIQIDNAPSTAEYQKNHFRLKQIMAGLEIIRKYPQVIKSGSELKDIKGIGKGIINRIDQILSKGHLDEIKINKKEITMAKYIEELQEIHGIGHKTAYDFVIKYGIKSIAELKKAYNDGSVELSNTIITGLKYHDLYKKNIPRNEMDKINNYLQQKAKLVDKHFAITICGSYRRLKPTSNDVDVLVYHPQIKTKLQLSEQLNNNYLFKFIEILKKDKFLLDDLTDKDYEIKYMGYCQFKENSKKYDIRRIDIRYIPYDSLSSALQYFTGSGAFNKRIRALAEQLGYLLNEYGLYKLNGDKKTRIKITSEKDIFDKLGMEYLLPEQRN